MATPRVKPSPEELLVRRALNDKLESARAELRDSERALSAALQRAESAERAVSALRDEILFLQSDIEDVRAGRESYEAAANRTIESLRSEVAAMATDKERADQAEAALAVQAEKQAAEVAELRAQLKDLQVKQYEFRLAVEKLL